MNDRQRRFAEEYLVDLNATQAAIRAGYSKKTAYSIGQQLLKKIEIQEAIEEGQAARSERTEITQDYVLNGIKDVVETCCQPEAFDAQAALRGYELMGKHLGMFNPARAVDLTSGGKPIKPQLIELVAAQFPDDIEQDDEEDTE